MDLWELWRTCKQSCRLVDLTHPLSPDTPRWDGFPAMEMEPIYTHEKDGFLAYNHLIAGQFGTHVDAPCHFNEGRQTLDYFTPDDMIMPLVVIDMTQQAAENPDYALTVDDVKKWEAEHGRIPEGAFAALRTDWSRKGTSEAMDNRDAEGNKHYPGWHVDTVKWLVENRNIGAIGHETSDTDSAVYAATVGYDAEIYILSQNRFQIELLKNLDLVPETGALIFCTFPKLVGGAGFPARCFAMCEKK